MATKFLIALIILCQFSAMIKAHEAKPSPTDSNQAAIPNEPKAKLGHHKAFPIPDPCADPRYWRLAYCRLRPRPFPWGHHHHHHHHDHGRRGRAPHKPMCESVTTLIQNCGSDFYLDETTRHDCCRDVDDISADCFTHNLGSTERELLSVVKKICTEYDHRSPSESSPPPAKPEPPVSPPKSSSPAKPQPPPTSPPQPSSPPLKTEPPTSPPKSSSPPAPPTSPAKPQPPISPPAKQEPPKSPPKSSSPSPKTEPPTSPPKNSSPAKPEPPTSPPKSSPPAKPKTPSSPPKSAPLPPPSPPKPSPSNPSPPEQPPHGHRPENCLVETVLYDGCDPKFPVADNKNASSEEKDFAPGNISTGFMTDAPGCCLGFALFTNDCKPAIKDLSFAKQRVFSNLQAACGATYH